MDHRKESVESLPKPVVLTLAHIDAIALGIAVGAVAAFWIVAGTLFLILKGGEVVGPRLFLLSQYFFGYRVTFTGSLIGGAYGFFCGFLAGYAFAALRNFFIHGYLTFIYRRAQQQALNDLP